MPRRTISCLLLANVGLIAAVVPAASAPKKGTAGPPLSIANVNDATWRQGTQSTPFLISCRSYWIALMLLPAKSTPSPARTPQSRGCLSRDAKPAVWRENR